MFVEPDYVYCVMFSLFSSFLAPLGYYASDVQCDGRLESVDSELTTLHEKVLQIKEGLNWDEEGDPQSGYDTAMTVKCTRRAVLQAVRAIKDN